MSITANWHPNGSAYNATVGQCDGTIWVTIGQEDGQAAFTFFFEIRSHAESVAAAFNGELIIADSEPETEQPLKEATA